MSMIRFILKKAAPMERIEHYQRFLFIGPHPDDIELGAGATAAKLAASGKTVRFLIVTDGRFGLENAPKGTTCQQLVVIRKKETIAASAALGITDVVFLDFSDGGQYERRQVLNSLAKAVGEFQPDVILAPDPDVRSECHKDHLVTGQAAKEIAFFSAFPQIAQCYGAKSADVKAIAFFMTARPNQYIRTGRFLGRQLDALFSNHLSHFPPSSSEAKAFPTYLRLRSFFFGIRRFCLHAEGFRVLDRMHMHCLPETDN